MLSYLYLCVVGYVGISKYPYRAAPMEAQTERITKIPRLNGLNVSKEKYTYINSVNRVLRDNGFEPGAPMIGFYRLPGVIYAASGKSLGGIYWNRPQIALYAENLKIALEEEDQKPYILLSPSIHENNLVPEMKEDLAEFGIDIDHDYILVDSIKCAKSLDHAQRKDVYTYVYRPK